MKDMQTKTSLRKPDGQSRGVFDVGNGNIGPDGRPIGSRRWYHALLFWREASQWSIIAFVCALAVAALAVTSLTGWVSDWRSSVRGHRAAAAPVAVTPPIAPVAPTRRRLIDGIAVPADAPAVSHYYAVTMDDHPSARPQSGIDKASVVYEAPVEGGINRFLVIFPDDVSVEKIGPVRSARPYFLDWISEYDALYAHVGGSPEALDDIKADGLRDMNEFFNGASFWRSTDREAPHNAYTSTELLGKNFDRRFGDAAPTQLDGWKFKDDAPAAERPDAQKISIAFGDSETDVTWTYDRGANSYARTQGGRAVKTLEGAAVAAKNVVVQFADVQTIDSYGRRKIGTVGTGDAIIIFDGHTYHGSWKKKDRASRTRFYDASKNEIIFDAGTTWVEVVPTGTEVKE